MFINLSLEEFIIFRGSQPYSYFILFVFKIELLNSLLKSYLIFTLSLSLSLSLSETIRTVI